MEHLIGHSLGQYQIIKKIGQGGMAYIFKAYQSVLSRMVAVKVLSPALAAEPGFSASFQQEAYTLARLNHPHILPAYDFGIQDNYHYLVMRYISGATSLTELIKQDAPPEQLLDYIIQAAEALHYAHEQGLIHQDVKPANILIDGQYALLSDFGLAKDYRSQDDDLNPGLGSLVYMSPEQISGGRVDQRTDIYALGVILYQIVTAKLPPPLPDRFIHIPEPRPDLEPITAHKLAAIAMRAIGNRSPPL